MSSYVAESYALSYPLITFLDLVIKHTQEKYPIRSLNKAIRTLENTIEDPYLREVQICTWKHKVGKIDVASLIRDYDLPGDFVYILDSVLNTAREYAICGLDIDIPICAAVLAIENYVEKKFHV